MKTFIREARRNSRHNFSRCWQVRPLALTLDKLTPQHLQDYYNFKGKGNGKKKGLSPNSLVVHHVIILGALKEAVR